MQETENMRQTDRLQLYLGTAKTDITPKRPIQLAGYGHRNGKVFEKVAHRLYARVFAFEQRDAEAASAQSGMNQADKRSFSDNIDGKVNGSGRRAVLIQADFIWWGNDLTDRIQKSISQRWHLEQSAILLNASHSHSGPQTSNDLLPSLGELDREYIHQLEQAVLDAAAQAFDNMEPVTVERSHGQCSVGIHRRRRIDGKVMNAPNPEGPVDSEVTVFRFRRTKPWGSSEQEGSTKAVLFHYTCHPTVMGDFTVTSEFTGYAMEKLERELANCGAIAAFLQGCCGDVRPALVKEERFYRGDEEDVARLGSELADAVLHAMQQPMEQLEIVPLQSRNSAVPLPFDQLPDEAMLRQWEHEEGYLGEWSRLMLSEPSRLAPTIPLRLSFVQLAHGLAFIAMNGEVVVDYGLYVKELTKKQVLPLAYSNGMIGYVPTAKQLEEGGYESKDSFYYFGLPAPFSDELETRIKEGIRKIIEA